MADYKSLHPDAASQLSYIHPSRPVWPGITPRWILSVLPFVSIQSGSYRVNRVRSGSGFSVIHRAPHDSELPTTFADYDQDPIEVPLDSIHSILRLHTVSGDLHNVPHSQLKEQTRLVVEALKEEQERQILENPSTGLANAAADEMKVSCSGFPTPDAMDDLLEKVWEKPSFFVAHPKMICAFEKECTKKAIATETVGMLGAPFVTWRGVPIIPSNKLRCEETSKILLMRVGEEDQGVIGISQSGIAGEISPGLSMRMSGIDERGCTNYLFVLYFAVTVLSPSALGVMECGRV